MSFRFFKKIFRSRFKPLYDEARLLPEIRRSILFVIFGNIFGNLWGAITTGTALTGYAQALGSNDFTYGVLTGIPLAAALLQIPFSVLVSRTQKRKKYMLTFGAFSRALWIVVGLVPYFLPMEPTWLRLWSVIFLVGIASASGSSINVCFTPWLADLVPIRIRGRWLSLRDSIISVVSVLIGLLTAYLLDTIKGYPGYALVFVVGGVLGVMDMLCFIFVKEVYAQPPLKVRILPMLKRIFWDKPFFTFMLFWTAWCFTSNLAAPFLTRYALGDLKLSFLQVTLCSQIAASVVTVLVVSKWGRLLDRYGSKPILLISTLMSSLAPAFYLFATPGNVLPVLLHNAVGAAFWSASNVTSTSMQLSYSPDEMRPSYIAVYSCVTSLFGSFLGTISGGALLELIRGFVLAKGIFLLGAPADPYKIVVCISVLLRLSVVLLFVPKLKSDNEHTLRSMFADMKESFKRSRAQRRF